MNKEIWKPIPSYPGYEISNMGSVKVPSLRASGRICKEYITKGIKTNKYRSIYLGHPRKPYYIHILVLECFIGPPKQGQESRHLNDKGHDNRLTNLKWGTSKQNKRDALRNNNYQAYKGNKCKLLIDDIIIIRKLYSKGGITIKILSKSFSVSPMTIWRVISNTTYKYLRRKENRAEQVRRETGKMRREKMKQRER